MAEKPILFNTEMVRAILDGRKTQTRRIVKLNNHKAPTGDYVHLSDDLGFPASQGCLWAGFGNPNDPIYAKSRYQVGDLLYVRETFVIENTRDYAEYVNKIPTDRPVKRIENDWDGVYHLIPHYRATESEPHITNDPDSDITKWRPNIFMPKWVARIWLEVTNVRVERVQDITSRDAAKEGIEQWGTDAHMKGEFLRLWDSINEKRGFGWDKNPWVWVYEFKRIEHGSNL
jgi:hypothetical protein